jgi:hypothetical protein
MQKAKKQEGLKKTKTKKNKVKQMLIETSLVLAVAIALALFSLIARETEFENQAIGKALNIAAGALFALAFFLENQIIPLAFGIIWFLLSAIFLLKTENPLSSLRGWDEDFKPRGSSIAKKKKRHYVRKPKEETANNNENKDSGSGPIWPWS